MARPSRWMQFANNFNAMNSTLNQAFQKYEIGKINKQEFEDDDGNALEGDALSRARTDAMAGVYEKYGDAEKAMSLRAKGAELEGLMRTNRIGAATEDSQIYVQGEGAVQKLNSGIAANNASTAASNASTRLSNLQTENLQREVDYRDTLNNVLTSVGQMEFESEKDENAYLIKALKEANLPPETRQAALKSVMEFGSTAIALESQQIVAGAEKAIRKGNFVDWYNQEVADGFQLAVETVDGVTTAYATGDDGERRVVTRAEGTEGNAMVLNTLFQQVKDPANILGAAVDNLAYKQSKATLEQTKTKTDTMVSGMAVDAAQIERIASQINVDVAQVQNIQSQIGLRSAQALQVAAETQQLGVKTEKLQAEINNINSLISSRGIQDSLNAANVELVGANVALAKQKLVIQDPNREMSAPERQKFLETNFSKIVGQMYAVDPNTTAAQIDAARVAYFGAMTPEGVSHSEDEE